jgi:hypothetical protein
LTAPQSSHLDAPPHHYFHFTSYGLKLLLQNAGVEVLRLEPQGGHFRYLGTQLHYICVVIRRAMQTRLRRIVLFPVLVICTVLFGLFTKVLCLWLDRFDHDRLNTMGWNCHARRPANTLADISPAKYKHGEIVMRRSNRVLCATLVCLIYFGFLKGAYAYLDPGTGSYVIQVVIAVVAGALLTAKMFWTRIKLFFKNLFSKKP